MVVTIDTGAPTAPSAPDLRAGSDFGTSNTDDATRFTTPTIAGTGEAGAMVTLFEGAVALGAAKVGPDGGWSVVTPTLTDGAHALTARQVDAAGNVSALSGKLTIVVDTVAPPPTSATLLSPALLTGKAQPFDVVSVLRGRRRWVWPRRARVASEVCR